MKFGHWILLPWPQVWSNKVFTIVEEEDHGNSYHLDVTMQTCDNEDEVEVAINLFNIARTFQGVAIVICTKVECPSSSIPHYYVEMPCNLTTPTTNLQKVVNLKDPCLELDDLNVSYQTQQVFAWANLLSLLQLPKRRTFGKDSLIDYSSSHVMTSDPYLVMFKQKTMDKKAMDKVKELKVKKERKKIEKVSNIYLPWSGE